MAVRIAKHQQQRDMQQWQLVECPLELSQLIPNLDKQHCYLLDCLTLWLNNILMAALESETSDKEQYKNAEQDDLCCDGLSCDGIAAEIDELVAQLIDSLKRCPANIVIVTNEVGQGIVPLGQQSRLFVDHAGWLNQKIATIADEVTLVTAGLPMTLKSAKNYEQLSGSNNE